MPSPDKTDESTAVAHAARTPQATEALSGPQEPRTPLPCRQSHNSTRSRGSGPHSPQDEAPAAQASPVTELRTAVAKLRKHVKHATDGPWVTSTVWSPHATATSAVYSHAHPTGTVDSEVVASGRIKSGYGGIREPWNAEYIALMQPSVGQALAALLELEADVIEARLMHDGSLEFAVDLSGDHALAIARLINSDDRERVRA